MQAKPTATGGGADGRWDLSTPFRYLVDMHVPDWDAQMLAKYDAEAIVRHVKRTGAQSLMIYAKSHAGQLLWNTALAGRHRTMGSRDFFTSDVYARLEHVNAFREPLAGAMGGRILGDIAPFRHLAMLSIPLTETAVKGGST